MVIIVEIGMLIIFMSITIEAAPQAEMLNKVKTEGAARGFN